MPSSICGLGFRGLRIFSADTDFVLSGYVRGAVLFYHRPYPGRGAHPSDGHGHRILAHHGRAVFRPHGDRPQPGQVRQLSHGPGQLPGRLVLWGTELRDGGCEHVLRRVLGVSRRRCVKHRWRDDPGDDPQRLRQGLCRRPERRLLDHRHHHSAEHPHDSLCVGHRGFHSQTLPGRRHPGDPGGVGPDDRRRDSGLPPEALPCTAAVRCHRLAPAHKSLAGALHSR